MATHSFISAKRAAFQIFVAKFLYPATRLSASFRSRPMAAIDAKVKRTASAPYFSISSRGSMTFPSDFAIFLPC